MGIGASVAAVTLGATVVEKHLTLRRADGGVDSEFSMEPDEFGNLVREAEIARQALGKVQFGPSEGDDRSFELIFIPGITGNAQMLTLKKARNHLLNCET